ncbi:MAG: hypothetical protein KKH08_04235 [Candidatus Omnitrophica bacterium]|nr:hypothetical protein [Candidatus Omnitrophota bacterium]
MSSHGNFMKARTTDFSCSSTPIECIRKARCLNIDRSSVRVSREVYKIIKSKNGRKIFA